MKPHRRSILALSWLLTVMGLFGCGPSGPANAPTEAVTWSYQTTSDWVDQAPAASTTDPAVVDPNRLVGVEIWVLATTRPPRPTLDPLVQHVRAITTSPDGPFVSSVARRLAGTRLGPVQDVAALSETLRRQEAGRVTVEAHERGLLAETSRWRLALRRSDDPSVLELTVVRPAGSSDPGAAGRTSLQWSLARRQSTAEGPWEERLWLEPALSSGDTWAAVIPAWRPSDWAPVTAVVCRDLGPVDPTADPNHWQDIWQTCQDQLRASRIDRPSNPAVARAATLAEWVDALRWPTRQRGALVALTADSPLAHDIALSGLRTTVTALANPLIAAYDRGELTPERAPWVIERAAFEVCLAQWESDRMNPSLQALLTLHAGQVGRDVPTLRRILQEVDDPKTFGQRLIQENLIYLRDISPAVRWRAARWLQNRQALPPGFDPLAPAEQRRAALSALAESTNEQDPNHAPVP